MLLAPGSIQPQSSFPVPSGYSLGSCPQGTASGSHALGVSGLCPQGIVWGHALGYSLRKSCSGVKSEGHIIGAHQSQVVMLWGV